MKQYKINILIASLLAVCLLTVPFYKWRHKSFDAENTSQLLGKTEDQIRQQMGTPDASGDMGLLQSNEKVVWQYLHVVKDANGSWVELYIYFDHTGHATRVWP
jgi:hypothetical protein